MRETENGGRKETMDPRTIVAITLSLLGILCAAVGIFVIDGISIEFPGIIFAALGYYFSLQSDNRVGRILGIAAAALNVISMAFSGLTDPPQ